MSNNEPPGWAACHGRSNTDKKGATMTTQNQLLIAEAIVIDRKEGRTKATLFLKKNAPHLTFERLQDILDQHADKKGHPMMTEEKFEEPNVAHRINEDEINFYWTPEDPAPIKVTLTNDGTILHVNGAFFFFNNPFWLFDLFSEFLPVGGIYYFDPLNP